jgi:hypothetical protein
MYQAQQQAEGGAAEGQAGQEGTSESDEEVTDVDFEEVEDKK